MGVQTTTTWTISLACFGGRGLLKTSQQPGQPEEIPYESIIRDPLVDSASLKIRVAGDSQVLHWSRV